VKDTDQKCLVSGYSWLH